MKTNPKKTEPDLLNTAPLRSNSQPVIGFLCPDLNYSIPQRYWAGINEVVSAQGGNLIVLAGTSENPTNMFLDVSGVLFDLIDTRNFDGLIIWGNAIFSYLSLEESRAFCNRYLPLPIVSIGSTPVDSIPEIVINNYLGMYNAVEHLIIAHGYKKIAFIQGPEENLESVERYQAYTDALAAHGLVVDPGLVLPGNFVPSSGLKAAKILLDERGLRPQIDFDAVVAANDEMILSVSRLFKERGISVPNQVALVGFDNIPETQFVMPPLTTVRQPLYENGKLAAELLFAILAGQDVPQQTVTPSELVVRQSCGCISSSIVRAGTGTIHRIKQPLETAIAGQRERILLEMVNAAGASAIAPAQAAELLDTLVADLLPDSIDELSPPNAFLSTLNNALNQTVATRANIATWQEMVSVLSNSLLPYLSDKQLIQAMGLLQQARVMIGEVALQYLSNQSLQTKNQADILRETSHLLKTSFNIGELGEVLVTSLLQLGISGCYLSLYEDPANPTEWARLILAYSHNKQIALEPEGRRFSAGQLIPEGILPLDQAYQLVAVPLTFKYQQLGFVLFEAALHDGPLCEALGAELSTALQGAFLIKKEAERARELAQANADLKAAQIELLRKERLVTLGQLNAIVSHEIRNPLGTIRASAYSIDQRTRGKGLRVERALDRIQRNITRCDTIIGELLDYTRDREIEVQTIRFDEWLHQVLDEQTIPDGITLSRELSTGAEVLLDPERFRRMVVNLFDNACQAIQEKPDTTGPEQIVVTAKVVDQQIMLSVVDTGSGIPPEVMSQIFEPLYSTKSFGVGLGLAVVQEIIQQHAGKIEINSEVGTGTQVMIWLPLA